MRNNKIIKLSVVFLTILVLFLLYAPASNKSSNSTPSKQQTKEEKPIKTPVAEAEAPKQAPVELEEQQTKPVPPVAVTPKQAPVNRPVAAAPAQPVQPQPVPQLSPNEAETLVNAMRANNGINGLSSNQRLRNSACAKAQDMISRQYWGHNAPDGTTPWSFIARAGYSYSIAGENLAYGFSDMASTVDGWMNSQTHRDNILNNNFTEQGICSLSGQFMGSYTVVTVQHLGKK